MRFRQSVITLLTFLLLIFVVYGDDSMTPSSVAEATINETQIEPLVYFVCDPLKEPSYANCWCRDKTILCYTSFWNAKDVFKNANIQIINTNFTAEHIAFNGQNFGSLKRAETLPNIAGNIKYLSLDSSKITDIENGTFDKFNNLESLSLVNNEFKNLTDGVLTEKLGSTLKIFVLGGYSLNISQINFKYMTNLKSLHLDNSYNVGKIFTSNSTWKFPKSLPNLERLSLSGCNISSVPDNIFENLISLSSLFLYHNPITIYPKSLNSISTLRDLSLNHTLISDLRDGLRGN